MIYNANRDPSKCRALKSKDFNPYECQRPQLKSPKKISESFERLSLVSKRGKRDVWPEIKRC